MDKKDIIIAVLAIILVTMSYSIGFDKYTQMKEDIKQTSYMQGINDGVNGTIIQVMQQASTCQPVSLMSNGQRIEVIAVQCLENK